MDFQYTAQKSINLDINTLSVGRRNITSTNIKPLRSKKRRDVYLGDRLFYWLVKAAGVSIALLLLSMIIFLFVASLPTIEKFGFNFLVNSHWDPVRDIYGAMPVIWGTVVSSFLAILFAAPISVGIALYLNEISNAGPARIIGFLVQMLAAIPSVIYGLWGIFVLAPFFQSTLQPFLIAKLGFLPFFQGPAYGVGMLTSAVILAIMLLPTISSITIEVFKAVPQQQREAALALGATRWEMIWISVLKSSKTGIFAAVILGLGRAIGETMAVTMLIGNRAEISFSLFAPAQTMASVIANEYAEATSALHLAALAEVGLVLFGVTFIINSLARAFIWKITRPSGLK